MLRLMHFKVIAIVVSILLLTSCFKDDDFYLQETITFQEVRLAPETYWNGDDEKGSKSFGSVTFYNFYDKNDQGGDWVGFAYSNITDIKTPGIENQYSAYIHNQGNPTNVYSVVHVKEESATMWFVREAVPISILVSNTTPVYYSLLNGDESIEPLKKDEWFMLTITGYNIDSEIVNSIDFYLADYRGELPKIVDDWSQIDLTSLSGSSKIIFTLSSSSYSESDMKILSYFCVENFVIEFR